MFRRLIAAGGLALVLVAGASCGADAPSGQQAATGPAAAAGAPLAAGAGPDRDRLRPKVRLGAVPAIAPGARKGVTKEEAERIKARIANLAEIDAPDFGLSPTMSGTAFLPLPDLSRMDTMILMDHRLKSSQALEKLVERGPDAIPFLLDALDDTTPTKLTVKTGDIMAAMWFADEVWGNPANEAEMAAIGPRRDAPGEEEYVDSYTVKVGDVCFVALGQIAGRPYQAVRYRPTGCIVINSPTHDARLCARVRAIWSSDDAAAMLLHSLLVDYATEGVFQGPSLDSWYPGSELETQAAMRLLYYYPDESAQLISDRLARLDVMKAGPGEPSSPAAGGDVDGWVRREVANGVRTDEFVKAVSWCRQPLVRAAVHDIFERTTDVDVLLAALPGIDDAEKDLIRSRLGAFLDEEPAEEDGAYGADYSLLCAMAQRLGKDAAPAFGRYLENASAQRCHSAAGALKESTGDWSVPLLLPLLDDRRPVGDYDRQVAPDVNRRLPIRVCDTAAETLSQLRPDLEFKMEGDFGKLDDQIKTIQERLARG